MLTPHIQRCLAAVTGLTVLVGCSSPPPSQPPATTPVGTAAADQQVLGVYGRAEMPSAPFGDAELTVFRLDNDLQVGKGKTAPDGAFGVTLDASVVPGTPLRIVAAKDGKTLGALGTAGNISSTSLRYVVQQQSDQEVKMSIASTLALMAFMKRMKAIGIALTLPNTNRISFNALALLLAMYKKAEQAAQLTIAKYQGLKSESSGLSFTEMIAASYKPDGTGQLPQDTLNAITAADSPLTQAASDILNTSQQALTTAQTELNTTVPAELTQAESFGQIAMPQPTVVSPSAPAPTAPTVPTAPVAPKPAGGGGSGGGGSSGGGGTTTPTTPSGPTFVNAGVLLNASLPTIAALPAPGTLTFNRNLVLPERGVVPGTSYTFTSSFGLPNRGTPDSVGTLGLNSNTSLPNRTSGTTSNVALNTRTALPQATSAASGNVTMNVRLGLPVAKPVPGASFAPIAVGPSPLSFEEFVSGTSGPMAVVAVYTPEQIFQVSHADATRYYTEGVSSITGLGDPGDQYFLFATDYTSDCPELPVLCSTGNYFVARFPATDTFEHPFPNHILYGTKSALPLAGNLTDPTP